MNIIVFIGCPAAGKSTFFKQHFVDSHIRLNLDMLKTRHRERILLQACFDAKQPCVIDNTNPTVASRQAYIAAAKAAHFRAIAYFFITDLHTALQRNAQREGKAKIPEVGVRAIYRTLQAPHYSEGFDEIYHVLLTKPEGFHCKKIANDSSAATQTAAR